MWVGLVDVDPFEIFQNKSYIYDLMTSIGMLSLAEGDLFLGRRASPHLYKSWWQQWGEEEMQVVKSLVRMERNNVTICLTSLMGSPDQLWKGCVEKKETTQVVVLEIDQSTSLTSSHVT